MKIKNKIIKEYSDTPIDDLAGKPVFALSGISDRNALTLYKVFHIETIHDLGNLEFARRAGKICEAADKGESSLHGDFAETALKKKFRKFTPALLADSPVHILLGISGKNASLLRRDLGIITVRDLARIRFIPLARKLDFKEKLIKAYEETHLAALPKAPVYALQGISIKDAGLLRKAFHLETIEDLAGLKYFHWAKEIADAYEKGAEIDMELFSERLVKKYKTQSVNKLINAPVSALHGISKNDEELIYRAFKIKTIKKFAELKYWRWACGIMELYASEAAEPEIPAGKKRIPLWMKVLFFFVALLSSLTLIFFTDIKGIKQKTLEFFKAGNSTSRGEVMPDRSSAHTENVNLPAETEKSADKEGYYTVQPGDSLISISIKLTGSYEKWVEIYRENRNIINNPQLLYPGQKLRLPVSMTMKHNKQSGFLFKKTGGIFEYYKALLYFRR